MRSNTVSTTGQSRDNPSGLNASNPYPDPAWQEEPQTNNTEQHEVLTVRDIMVSTVYSVRPETSARDVAEIMRRSDIGMVSVVGPEGRLEGVITDRDLVVRGICGSRDLAELSAQDLATKEVRTAKINSSVEEILDLMGDQHVRQLPIIDDGGLLVGMVSISDIANRADHSEDLKAALSHISGKRSFWSRTWR